MTFAQAYAQAPQVSIPRFRAALEGRVITARDAGYDEARTVASGVDRRPALIVRVADATDVARTVALARESGLEIAVRSGGHSAAGHGVVDGGLVIDLSALRGLEIDAQRRVAWAEAGMTAGQYTIAAAAHDMATPFGDSGSVGLGGITLGGGVGFLSRRHGLTIDSLLGAEVVTADGRIVYADADRHPDLFWAIRGGGGNFGVVTGFRFRLHPVEEIVGGMLMLPATPEVIAAFVAAAEDAPDELTTIANVMPAPPLPFVPEGDRGRLVVMAMLAYLGEPDAGRRAVAPFRALAAPIADTVKPMLYPEILAPAAEGPGPIAAVRTLFVDGVNLQAAETIVEHLRAGTGTAAVAQIRVLGGAIARVGADATAYAHRDRRVMVNVAALYENSLEAAVHEAWADAFAADLRRGRPGAYVNFLGDEGLERVREAYPGPTWDRLAAVKARYDPDNVFHMNQNVPPAARG